MSLEIEKELRKELNDKIHEVNTLKMKIMLNDTGVESTGQRTTWNCMKVCKSNSKWKLDNQALEFKEKLRDIYNEMIIKDEEISKLLLIRNENKHLSEKCLQLENELDKERSEKLNISNQLNDCQKILKRAKKAFLREAEEFIEIRKDMKKKYEVKSKTLYWAKNLILKQQNENINYIKIINHQENVLDEYKLTINKQINDISSLNDIGVDVEKVSRNEKAKKSKKSNDGKLSSEEIKMRKKNKAKKRLRNKSHINLNRRCSLTKFNNWFGESNADFRRDNQSTVIHNLERYNKRNNIFGIEFLKLNITSAMPSNTLQSSEYVMTNESIANEWQPQA